MTAAESLRQAEVGFFMALAHVAEELARSAGMTVEADGVAEAAQTYLSAIAKAVLAEPPNESVPA